MATAALRYHLLQQLLLWLKVHTTVTVACTRNHGLGHDYYTETYTTTTTTYVVEVEAA